MGFNNNALTRAIGRDPVMPVKTGSQKHGTLWIPGRASFASLPVMTV